VSALVVLSGSLPRHSQALSDLWPANAESYRVVDEHG